MPNARLIPICLIINVFIFFIPSNTVFANDVLHNTGNIQIVETFSAQTISSAQLEVQQPTNFTQIEYKKISPIKYRIILRGISHSFVLILTETFNIGWKLYPVQLLPHKPFATAPKSIIENISLPEGSFFETYRLNSLDESHHRKVRNFSNGWVIDAKSIYVNFPQKHQMEYGLFDLEVIVEYMPQRIYILGLLISFIVVLGCVIYLFTVLQRRRNAT